MAQAATTSCQAILDDSISPRARALIATEDEKLNKRAGYSANDIARFVSSLLEFGWVEVGQRHSCGATDPTMFIHRSWVRVLKRLRDDGLTISEEKQKHDNAWATKSRGFWNSTKYTLVSASNTEDSSAVTTEGHE